ncbi:unannotated protein [freshwater metagenome]|uniref:Unannotated protein n=1 Tax=freshwater metagenome TaxID=449393 RepID=A0A6J7DDG5_9ZZZZ|nr:MerR family transcriptional regulator [Actinomycetota bacterium]
MTMTAKTPAPVTICAGEFAALTGVGRERLRTWERRHGFPEPVRSPGAARRYDVGDVRRVLAVRRAIEQGVPLLEAIDGAEHGDGRQPAGRSVPDLVAALDHAPFAALVVSGPQPLEVVWVNGCLRAVPDGPSAGDDLLRSAPAFAGGAGHAALEALFAGGDGPAWIEHPSWTEHFPVATASVGWCLPQEPGTAPLAALVAIPTRAFDGELPDGDAIERQMSRLRGSLDRVNAWTVAVDDAAGALRENGGVDAASEALRRLAARIGALDAALLPVVDGTLVASPSLKGMLEPSAVDPAAFPEVAGALRDSAVDWLDLPACHAFGVPGEGAAVIVPIVAAGRTLGLLLLVFRREVPLGDAERDLLLGLATTIGFALIGSPVRA